MWTPKIDRATWPFLGLSDIHVTGAFLKFDRATGAFLKIDRVTGAFLKFDRATLPFLIIDMRHGDLPSTPPPSISPYPLG